MGNKEDWEELERWNKERIEKQKRHGSTKRVTFKLLSIIRKKVREILVILIAFTIFMSFIFAIIIINGVKINSNGKLDKSNPMTREEVISLIEKGIENTNFYLCSNTNTKTKQEHYIKDNIVVFYRNSKLESWSNYNTNERITINNGNVTVKNDIELNEDMFQFGWDYSLIKREKDYDLNYKYLGEKIMFGRKVILIEESNIYSANKFIIDKQTGVILEKIALRRVLYMTVSQLACTTREIKMDVVTDEDIMRPKI